MDFPLFASALSYPFNLHDARVVKASMEDGRLRLVLSIYDDWDSKPGTYFNYTLDFVDASPVDLETFADGDIYSQTLTFADGLVTVQLLMNGGDTSQFSCSEVVEVSVSEVRP